MASELEVGKLSVKGVTATSEASHITFTNTQGAKVFAVGGGKSGVSNNGFCIVNVTDDSAPLTISDAGLCTFAAGIVSSAMPTSDPSVAGQLWNDSGTVKISSG